MSAVFAWVVGGYVVCAMIAYAGIAVLILRMQPADPGEDALGLLPEAVDEAAEVLVANRS